MTNTSLSAADTIRVATINLLHNPEEAEVRFQGLQAELEKVNPDVICLQEATGKPYNAPQLIQEVLGEMEFLHAPDEYHGRFAGNAVMVKKSILDVDQPTSFTTLDLPTPTHISPVVLGSFVVRGKQVHVFSAHLQWMGHMEEARLNQVRFINKYAQELRAADRTCLTALAGDFNAQPGNDSLRFLRGEKVVEGEPSFWVDAWEASGSEENRITSNPDDHWNQVTARGTGILYPEHIPKRRIDYIMLEGWVYGRTGSPTAFGRFADSLIDGTNFTVSDHYGIWSDLLL